VELVLYAGVFVKIWSVREAGTLMPQHAHEFDHVTLLMRGAVRVWAGENLIGDVHAPGVIRIQAHTLHTFLTLTQDVALACVHNADHIDGDEPTVSQHAHLELED
jgi:hypothetical protein